MYVRITVDGVTYTLVKNAEGTWTVTNRAPLTAGEYLMTVTITTESGQEINIDTDDADLIRALTLIVESGNSPMGDRMLNYYPPVLKEILELKAIIKALGFEVDFLHADFDYTLNDAWLLTMGENRIAQWEKALGIVPSGTDTIDDRREVIIARFRGGGKLNTELINNIVAAFTNGTAEAYIANSILYVKINPPAGNKQYRFENVEKELQMRIPAHLGLNVSRNYSTWGEVKDNFATWNAVADLGDWETLRIYIAPQ